MPLNKPRRGLNTSIERAASSVLRTLPAGAQGERWITLNTALALGISAVFVGLALWHFRMAVSPRHRQGGAVPSVGGEPVFVPSVAATVGVGVALLLFALLVAASGGLVEVGVSPRFLSWASLALALGLFARSVGEFKYVGFFKRVRGSRFARLDSLVYSPLCLLLAVGVALVAQHNGI